MPIVMATGQAAGVCAALAARRGTHRPLGGRARGAARAVAAGREPAARACSGNGDSVLSARRSLRSANLAGRGALRWLVALAAVALAIGLRFALDPWLGDQVPFITIFGAVIVAAWYGGAASRQSRPRSLGYVAAEYFFVAAPAQNSRSSRFRSLPTRSRRCLIAASGRRDARESSSCGARAKNAFAASWRIRAAAVFIKDEGGRYVFMNPAAREDARRSRLARKDRRSAPAAGSRARHPCARSTGVGSGCAGELPALGIHVGGQAQFPQHQVPADGCRWPAPDRFGNHRCHGAGAGLGGAAAAARAAAPGDRHHVGRRGASFGGAQVCLGKPRVRRLGRSHARGADRPPGSRGDRHRWHARPASVRRAAAHGRAGGLRAAGALPAPGPALDLFGGRADLRRVRPAQRLGGGDLRHPRSKGSRSGAQFGARAAAAGGRQHAGGGGVVHPRPAL